MKRKILLLCGITCALASANAQKNTAYAITGSQKGHNNWAEVRLVDLTSGDEVQSIYKSSQQVEPLNARTGKPIVKQQVTEEGNSTITVQVFRRNTDGSMKPQQTVIRTRESVIDTYKPFATNSAACAYDKKHERLYYTPMGINQLRYIDLKKNRIYYLEDVPFGAVKGRGDVSNQITRMVFAADGNGYALTNNAEHLFKFTTGKKPTVTDLGALADDPANGRMSVHSAGGFGGDIIADAFGDLYLVTANRNVFKIDLETKVATFKGAITGLPRGFSTNGAMVEEESKVIVCSSNSTQGYFRFDLNSLVAEKISTGASVFNASDLANGVLAFEQKKKDEEKPAQAERTEQVQRKTTDEASLQNRLSIYPNPVTNGLVKVAFQGLPQGKYQVQLMEVSGKLINARQYAIANRMQVEEYRLPELLAGGNYVMKIMNEANEVVSVNKLVVQ